MDWTPKSNKGSVAQYVAPALVFAAAIALYVTLAVSYL